MILILIIILYFFYKKLKRVIAKNIVIEKIDLSPYQLGLMKLKKIEKFRISNADDSRQFGFEISNILREYLNGVFKINCFDYSNSELNEKLKKFFFLKKEEFILLLNSLEPIKFGGKIITDSGAQAAVAEAKIIININYEQKKN